ncbi:MAG: hypothetical protein EXR73_02405 [Myxococcales bacterium]|nr:hypothetical protein [Myxococcales bacterium]
MTLACLATLALTGCPLDEPLTPLVPTDWASTLVEVRDCRRSGDHDLQHVRVLADAIARPAYEARDRAFPALALLVKAEYADDACTDLVGFTAMHREPGFAPATGDWRWQKLDAHREVIEDGDLPRCASCHTLCGRAPEGHDGTCAVP